MLDRRHTGASLGDIFSIRNRRQIEDVAVMSTNYIGSGFANARLKDGTSVRIAADLQGLWHSYIRGVEVDGPPAATWEEAYSKLVAPLSAEMILLRLG